MCGPLTRFISREPFHTLALALTLLSYSHSSTRSCPACSFVHSFISRFCYPLTYPKEIRRCFSAVVARLRLPPAFAAAAVALHYDQYKYERVCIVYVVCVCLCISRSFCPLSMWSIIIFISHNLYSYAIRFATHQFIWFSMDFSVHTMRCIHAIYACGSIAIPQPTPFPQTHTHTHSRSSHSYSTFFTFLWLKSVLITMALRMVVAT